MCVQFCSVRQLIVCLCALVCALQEMYFIEKGSVEIIDPVSREIRGRLHAGSFFGELALLTGARRSLSVRSSRVGFVDLFVLSRVDFDSVLSWHPSLRDHLLRLVAGYMH